MIGEEQLVVSNQLGRRKIWENKTYGIWSWTDVRSMWYWKDLIKEAGQAGEFDNVEWIYCGRKEIK